MKVLTLLPMIFCLSVLFNSTHAVVKNSVGSGNWSTAATWSPAGMPASADTVNLFHPINLDVNIIIDGMMTVTGSGSLTNTNRSVGISLGATMFNNGGMWIKDFTNAGASTNNDTLFCDNNFSNTGLFTNNGYVQTMGNARNNPGGILTGNGGVFRICNNAINTAGGHITGTLDFCDCNIPGASPFNSGQSGTMDSAGITICGTALITPMAVTLSSFSAEDEKSNVLLRWTTGSEQNTSHFEIQRSKDGRTFESIGKTKGSGNSTSAKNYEYRDLTAFWGLSFYRLKEVDYNGNFDFSYIVIANHDDLIHKSMLAFPNPFKDDLEVIFDADQDGVLHATVFDKTGREMKDIVLEEHKGLNDYHLAIGDLPAGVYILSLHDAKEEKHLKIFHQP